jgi:hypothetical protein
VAPVRSIGGAAARRARVIVGWAGLAVMTLIGAAMLVAGCGGGSSEQGVASLGTTSTTTTTTAAGRSENTSSPTNTAIAFVGCMRTHGEPNMPEPSVRKTGGHTSVSINASSGIDPNSPLFAAADNACKHLLPNNGAPSKGNSITPADQKDYLKAAACMRAHGIPDFPDPTFQNGDVSFNSRTPIDTNTPQYTHALRTCQKLVPAGLPYSSSSG